MRTLCCLMLLTGCDALFEDTDVVAWTPDRPRDTDADTDPDTTPAPACPIGLEAASASAVTVQIAIVDSAQVNLAVATEAYEGVPPVCVSASGTEVQVLLASGEQPYAWVRSEADGVTNEVLPASTGVEVELFGAEPAITFGTGDWVDGSRTVSQSGSQWSHVVNGSARDDARSLALLIEVEVTP